MSQDEFTKLFKYMESFRKEVNSRFDETQKSIDRLTNTMDHFVKQLETIEVEQASRDLQFDRLLDWAREVSKKTGVPLRNL